MFDTLTCRWPEERRVCGVHQPFVTVKLKIILYVVFCADLFRRRGKLLVLQSCQYKLSITGWSSVTHLFEVRQQLFKVPALIPKEFPAIVVRFGSTIEHHPVQFCRTTDDLSLRNWNFATVQALSCCVG
jgi:hypothetical protein